MAPITFCLQCQSPLPGMAGYFGEPTCLTLQPRDTTPSPAPALAQAARDAEASVVIWSVSDRAGNDFATRYTVSDSGMPWTEDLLYGKITYTVPNPWNGSQCRVLASATTPTSDGASAALHDMAEVIYFFPRDTASVYSWRRETGVLMREGARTEYLPSTTDALRDRLTNELFDWKWQQGGLMCYLRDAKPWPYRSDDTFTTSRCDTSSINNLSKAERQANRVVGARLVKEVGEVIHSCLHTLPVKKFEFCPVITSERLAEYDSGTQTVRMFRDLMAEDFYRAATTTEQQQMERAILAHEICGHARHITESATEEDMRWSVASNYGFSYSVAKTLEDLFVTAQLPRECRTDFLQALKARYHLPTAHGAHAHQYGEVLAALEEVMMMHAAPSTPNGKPAPAAAPLDGASPSALDSAPVTAFLRDTNARLVDVQTVVVQHLTAFPEAAAELQWLYMLLLSDHHLTAEGRNVGLNWVASTALTLEIRVPGVAQFWSATVPYQCDQPHPEVAIEVVHATTGARTTLGTPSDLRHLRGEDWCDFGAFVAQQRTARTAHVTSPPPNAPVELETLEIRVP